MLYLIVQIMNLSKKKNILPAVLLIKSWQYLLHTNKNQICFRIANVLNNIQNKLLGIVRAKYIKLDGLQFLHLDSHAFINLPWLRSVLKCLCLCVCCMYLWLIVNYYNSLYLTSQSICNLSTVKRGKNIKCPVYNKMKYAGIKTHFSCLESLTLQKRIPKKRHHQNCITFSIKVGGLFVAINWSNPTLQSKTTIHQGLFQHTNLGPWPSSMYSQPMVPPIWNSHEQNFFY